MALFGLGKKKEAAAGKAVPTDAVLQMRQQGYSNDQVIQSLQQQGFSSALIFDAMSQADIKGEVGGEMPPAPPGGPLPEQMPPQAPPLQGPMPPPEMPQQIPPPEMPPMDAPGGGRAEIEEVAESIIDEKWEDLMQNVDKIITWKEETEAKMNKMQQAMDDLKEQFEVLHKGILSKISEYDRGIKGVSTDIKAMGDVFKKVLPTLTSDVGELSRITKKLSKKKK